MLVTQKKQPLAVKNVLADEFNDPEMSTKSPKVVTPSSIQQSEEEDDFEKHECDFNFCCICICVANICAPFYKTCTCAFHIVTSIPATSFGALALSITGITVFRRYFFILNNFLENAGLNGDYYLAPLDIVGGYLLVLDSLIMVCSALLTGWTRYAFCDCLRSGVFEYKRNQQIKLPCWSRFFRACGCSLLMILLLLSYGAWVLAVAAVVITSIAWFMSFMAITACHIGQDSVEELFNMLSRRLSFANIGTVEFENYCDSSQYRIRDSMQYILIGTLLILVGQVNFFCIMTDNIRVARHERKKLANRILGSQRQSKSVPGWGHADSRYL